MGVTKSSRRLLPSGKARPQRPKGFFRDARKEDARPPSLEYAPPSRLSINVAWKSWVKFCEDELPEDENDLHDPIQEADRVDREVDVQTVRAFLGWLLANSNFKQLDAVMSYCRHWRMAFRHHLKRRIDDQIAKDMKSYIHDPLKREYELSEISQFRATMNNDDVLAVLHYHWAVCNDYYPVERIRLQHALLILLCAGTSARPGTIIEGGGYYDENDALKYKDIKAHLVRDPEDPSRKVVVMLITLRLMKGYRNRGSPPTFIIYERPETPSFCIVSHILALAFDDDAFLSPFIREPEDVWAIDVPDHRCGTPLEWKESLADIPLLRRAVRTLTGAITSPTSAAQFNTMSKYNIRLGKSAGLEQPFRFYTLRRGAGHAINKNATEAERMQAMGHTDPQIYRRHYLNQIITTDTLACFLGAPSREGLMRLAGHMSLTRDSNAPTALTAAQKDEVRSHPGMQSAIQARDEARRELVSKYKTISSARLADPKGHSQYTILQRSVKAIEKKITSDKLKEIRNYFFATAGARYIEQQHRQNNRAQSLTLTAPGSEPLPLPSFDLNERKVLPSLLFPDLQWGSKEDPVTPPALCGLVKALRALCRRCTKPAKPSETLFECLKEEEIVHYEQVPDVFPIVVPGTVCLFCLGDAAPPMRKRTHAYARRSTLARHVENRHLSLLGPKKSFLCPHPSCTAQGVSLKGAMHFKNHAATVHNVIH